ncbi:8467_t:CDS:2 [Entrophospora sp. SA101]|nr:14411_t:CDS:2 [Entrophospora sp. SA101]CAJ0920930.1 8467_t:CDS:2 [Entrophospora sp. SA101]
MSSRAIQVWFQNRRAKLKRDAMELKSAADSNRNSKPKKLTLAVDYCKENHLNSVDIQSLNSSLIYPIDFNELNSPHTPSHIPPPSHYPHVHHPSHLRQEEFDENDDERSIITTSTSTTLNPYYEQNYQKISIPHGTLDLTTATATTNNSINNYFNNITNTNEFSSSIIDIEIDNNDQSLPSMTTNCLPSPTTTIWPSGTNAITNTITTTDNSSSLFDYIEKQQQQNISNSSLNHDNNNSRSQSPSFNEFDSSFKFNNHDSYNSHYDFNINALQNLGSNIIATTTTTSVLTDPLLKSLVTHSRHSSRHPSPSLSLSPSSYENEDDDDDSCWY